VVYHVIGADPTNGLRLEDGLIRWLNDGLAYLRMPLFTVLSGLVYGFRPFSQGDDSRAFLRAKVRRLLVPMLVVGTLFAVIQTLTPGTNAKVTDWRLLHIVPVAHFWFIESLFWVFLFIWFFDRSAWLSKPMSYALALAGSVAVYLGIKGTHFLSVDGAIYLLPYFLAGLGIARFDAHQKLRSHWVQTILLLLAVLAIYRLGVPVSNPDRRTVWILIAGLSLCGLTLSFQVKWHWLSRVGTASYAIYLYHVFFTAGTRIFLEKAGLAFIHLQISLGLITGIIGPMIINELFKKHGLTAILLLGKN
jgi:peptidoglycan/LPS O-acetylase OafA/YrhL